MQISVVYNASEQQTYRQKNRRLKQAKTDLHCIQVFISK